MSLIRPVEYLSNTKLLVPWIDRVPHRLV